MPNKRPLKNRVYNIIYEANTPTGKLFDILLLITILLSVIFMALESVKSINDEFNQFFKVSEWVITILFTIEYILRIISNNRPFKYVFSFYGLVDFISMAPVYLSLIFSGTHVLATLRIFRLLRVFRILKIGRYIRESEQLKNALKASRPKILVFLYAVMVSSIFLGSLIYIVEDAEDGFTSIPRSIYWVIVTLTTVGYGDIAPQTVLGQFIATFIMVLGYGIIAVPTGIVSVEMGKKTFSKPPKEECKECGEKRHERLAEFCFKCGHKLP